MTPGLRRLYAPRPVAVRGRRRRRPAAVDGVAVEAVREEWLVEDRWWTPQPLRRHYFELVARRRPRRRSSSAARCGGRWFRQRA